MAQNTQAAAPAAPTFEQLLATNKENAAKATGRTMQILVTKVTDWKPTATGLGRKMVITDQGNFWVLTSSISNLPTSFPKPIQASAVLAANGTYLNMQRLEFPGLTAEITNAIRELPQGTALFASAKDLKLAV